MNGAPKMVLWVGHPPHEWGTQDGLEVGGRLEDDLGA
jgi:hypothetical protein